MNETLELLGLTGRKAAFYMAALELGEATISAISKHAGIGRTTSYDILNILIFEGFVGQMEKNGRIYVYAENPDTLLAKMDERRHNVVKAIPKIKAIYNRSHTKPRIRYYEGKDGIITVMDEILSTSSNEVLGVLSMVELLEIPGADYMENHIARRVEKNIALKVIRSHAEDIEDRWRTNQSQLREVRFAPDLTIFSMTTYIYDDVVVLISSKRENFAVHIESTEFTALQRTFFNTLWNVSTVV